MVNVNYSIDVDNLEETDILSLFIADYPCFS